MPPSAHEDERGSGPAEFILVSVLLTALTVAVLQLGFATYARNIVQDAAAEAAHHAALADVSDAEAEDRAREIVSRALGHDIIDDAAITRGSQEGVGIVTVSLGATLPIIGMLGVPSGTGVTARAPVETLD
ncbi:TadE/TadG family type IV pilus assembly protein [Microbacterium sp. G2-8]|uniref:TadE/TadG family type IV pilus assembly protein n=1 Tax=Microbacterium sp. G2-8 TaxID=2842454 RepID=UPI001C88F903|nr:TadE/TadG family type IV pilus assembly protein [Microbacterium sp. G2-8]